MRHKLCRSFHPWCPGVKNRCLLFKWCHQLLNILLWYWMRLTPTVSSLSKGRAGWETVGNTHRKANLVSVCLSNTVHLFDQSFHPLTGKLITQCTSNLVCTLFCLTIFETKSPSATGNQSRIIYLAWVMRTWAQQFTWLGPLLLTWVYMGLLTWF